MSMVLEDKVTPEQLGAFLMLLRVKEETPDQALELALNMRTNRNKTRH